MKEGFLGSGVSSTWVSMKELSWLAPEAGTELSAPGPEESGGKAGAGSAREGGGGAEVWWQNAFSSACQRMMDYPVLPQES